MVTLNPAIMVDDRGLEHKLERKPARKLMKAKRRAFLNFYIVFGDKVLAWKGAGYHDVPVQVIRRRADKILNAQESKEYLEKRKKALKDSDDIDVEWIVNEILANIEDAKKQKKCSDVNKGLELLAKYKGDISGLSKAEEGLLTEDEYEEWLKSELDLIERKRSVGLALAV